MDVGKRLTELRTLCGFTQNGLADFAGVSQSHLRRVELGEADITVGHLELLCDALNISLCDFFIESTGDNRTSAALSQLSPKQKQLLLDFLESL